MTPEDKAMQLHSRFKEITNDFDLAKRASMMCVYEIIDDRTEGEMDSAYRQEVRMFQAYMGTGQLEARADKFNEDLCRS